MAISKHRSRFKRHAMLAMLLWPTLFVLGNWSADSTRIRWDFTSAGRHTLSAETLAVLSSATSAIEVRAFLPTHVPPPYSTVVRGIRDGLADYQAVSPVPFKISIVDPLDPDLDTEERKALEQEAKSYGLKKADLQVIQADRRVRQAVWFGVVVLYGPRQIIMPRIDRPSQLEYALTGTLKKALNAKARESVIGFSSGHREPPILKSPLRSSLSTIGKLEDVPIDGTTIPQAIDVLVILGPQRPFNERERYTIDQFLMRGRTVVTFLDYRSQSTVFPEVLVPTVSGLETLFDAYGLKIDTTQTVVDRQNPGQAPLKKDESGRIVMGAHPLYPFVRPKDANHPTTVSISHLVTPMASPMDGQAAKDRGHQVEPLLVVGPGAVFRNDIRKSAPAAYLAPQKSDTQAQGAIVAMAVTGTLTSAFADKAVPAAPRQASTFKERPVPERPFLRAGQSDARLLVVTSGTRMLAAQNNALLFLQNSLAWGTADVSLTAIRSRSAEAPPLTVRTTTARLWCRIVNLIGPALLLVAIGLFLRIRRRVA